MKNLLIIKLKLAIILQKKFKQNDFGRFKLKPNLLNYLAKKFKNKKIFKNNYWQKNSKIKKFSKIIIGKKILKFEKI